ncbi:hypothetical protein [Streptomyces viridochromogenes]|nr:hypothetical protein [Streptomyces viridochromogenes]
MAKIFGFSGGDFAPLPDDVTVESTVTLSGGESLETTDGGITNRYETTDD